VDCKVVLLGSSGVGKTCLLDRYVNDSFEPSAKNTIGAAFAAKKVGQRSSEWQAASTVCFMMPVQSSASTHAWR
jgi:GTPase SAR1 family protein